MAYEGSRYPNEPPYSDYSDPRMQYPTSYSHNDPYKPKSRQSSRERSDGRAPEYPKYSQPQQPINEAVATAFNDKGTASALNPELIAQITQNVIQQLSRTSVDAGTPIQTTHQTNFPPPAQPYQPVPISPSTQSNASPPMPTRNVYTPPSPHKHPEYPNHGSPESHSSPPFVRPPSPREPPASQFEERRPPSRVSLTSETSKERPKGPTRLSTSKEETTLEKIWGQLFDEEGHPTPRLRQFLRGLAVHIIEDFEPVNSIVVTPSKLIAYYESVKLPNEIYPWATVFDDRESAISRMYRELECQHHLVQEHLDEKPDIPGLTPVGFEKWTTLLIQAHPNEEFERLRKAVLDMPISNPDDKKERFPKDISRRLFPGSEDRKVRDRVQRAMMEHANFCVPKNTTTEVPRQKEEPRSRYPPPEASQPPQMAHIPPNNLERERKPYSSIPSESAIDDANPSTPQPIERERKPYRVAPGGGRVYEEDGRTAMPSQLPRSNSTTERSRPIPMASQNHRGHGELPIPEVHQAHRIAAGGPRRRGHSPSLSAGNNEFRRSDGDLRIFPNATYQSSSMSSTSESAEDDGRRYPREAEMRRPEYARRQAEDEGSQYGASPSSRVRYDPRMDPRMDSNDPRRGSEEDYYRNRAPGGGSTYR